MDLETKLTVNAARVDPEGEWIEGEVDAIDLDEEYVKPFGGIRYRLFVQVFGSELLVKGHVEQDFDLVCSRCGKDFDTTVKTDELVASFPIDEQSPEVDLTDELRECIILALPTYPVCEEGCPGLSQSAEMPADDRWSALDALGAGGDEKKQKNLS